MISSDQAKLKMTIESIGEIEFRRLTVGDTQSIDQLMVKHELNNKNFVIRLLHHQLFLPKITLTEFEKYTDNDITRIAKNFIQMDNHIFKYFNDTGDIYADIRNAFKEFRLRHIKEMLNLSTGFKRIQNTLACFNSKYNAFTMPALGIKENIINSTFERIKLYDEKIKKTIMSMASPWFDELKYFTSVADYTDKILNPNIELNFKWIENQSGMFDEMRRNWEQFEIEYRIKEKVAVRILRKYKWFICPSMPAYAINYILQIAKKRDRKDSEINHLFIDYFSRDNWKNLELMVNGWKDSILLKKRLGVIKNCVHALQNPSTNKYNSVIVILPTLISQIDGIIQDINDKAKAYDSRNTNCNKWQDRFRHIVIAEQMGAMEELTCDILLNVLFQHSQRGKPLGTPFNFNRHKILHGEIVNYGRKDYLIRAFMVLDFLAFLHLEASR